MVKEETEPRSFIAIHFTCKPTKDIINALLYSSNDYLINKDCQPKLLPSYKLDGHNSNHAHIKCTVDQKEFRTNLFNY